jgi:hypothetical protein
MASVRLRVTLALPAAAVEAARFEECLIGLLEGETESQLVCVTALNQWAQSRKGTAHSDYLSPPASSSSPTFSMLKTEPAAFSRSSHSQNAGQKSSP